MRLPKLYYSCFFSITLLFIGSTPWGELAMAFEPPGPEERLKAIGPMAGLPEALRLALDAGTDFEPIPSPKPEDWLAAHPEPGQTFEEFVRSKPNRPDRTRNRIYLFPLGDFSPEGSPPVELLKKYTEVFFGMGAEVLSPKPGGDPPFTTRINPSTRKRQILSTDVLRYLKSLLTGDAFCLLAITMVDLYPDPTWNFVFGQASLRDRVGVFSFARYDPAFYGERRGREDWETLLKRSCKVLVHETGHMFSLAHCVYFRCVMNGSNHLQESDSRPQFLCPVCLRKLHSSIGFDVVLRYERMLKFYRRAGFGPEAQWIANRLRKISSARRP
ncbi:MAG: archaemetzincin [Deltaproteobacteria bacterium]|nr:archaemetzincin [Deltaproteobacteria bacterium]